MFSTREWGDVTGHRLVSGPRATSRDQRVETQVGIAMTVIYCLNSTDPRFHHYCTEAHAARTGSDREVPCETENDRVKRFSIAIYVALRR